MDTRSYPTPRHRSTPPGHQQTHVASLALAIAVATLFAAVASSCAPAGSLAYPMQVRMQAEPPAAGASKLPRWCEGGTCSVGPKVVLDERNVRSMMLQPGESRAGLLLRLNGAGLSRLRLFVKGNAGDRRLTLIVDGKAMQAWTAREALKTGTIKLVGPTADMLRLHDKLRSAPLRPAP
ncbi:MAG: hypothetical protein KC502_12330 [Myxococcales bacterium]|nr:hypothetical protein [Myxococcales bacterium]